MSRLPSSLVVLLLVACGGPPAGPEWPTCDTGLFDAEYTAARAASDASALSLARGDLSCDAPEPVRVSRPSAIEGPRVEGCGRWVDYVCDDEASDSPSCVVSTSPTPDWTDVEIASLGDVLRADLDACVADHEPVVLDVALTTEGRAVAGGIAERVPEPVRVCIRARIDRIEMGRTTRWPRTFVLRIAPGP